MREYERYIQTKRDQLSQQMSNLKESELQGLEKGIQLGEENKEKYAA